MMMQAKGIYVLMLKENKFLILIVFVAVFSNENRNHALCSIFLLCYRNAHQTLRELEKLWKHMPFHTFLILSNNFHFYFY